MDLHGSAKHAKLRTLEHMCIKSICQHAILFQCHTVIRESVSVFVYGCECVFVCVCVWMAG